MYDTEENMSIPDSTGNRHWNEYLEWVAEGNTADPVDTPLPPPTNDELIDMAGTVLVAFLRAYAKREGLTMKQIKSAIIAEM